MSLFRAAASIFLMVSHSFWMMSFPTVMMFSRRATAYNLLKISHRSIRIGMRGPPLSPMARNNFLIARKLKLSDEEVQEETSIT